ncbi:MAG: hypothetical protein U5L95_04980 [Candidatus Saccharibacteria bacterium]|nr:hypothetical protein [Candidatus Saccharibacteria bacterium]
MKAIKHNIEHYYQPTSSTCGYAALAILLSHRRSELTPNDVIKSVPQPKDEEGNPTGSITAQLAVWCLNNGYNLDFYSFDCQILDLSWHGFTEENLIERLEAVRDSRHVLNLGDKYWSKVYVEAYIQMLKAGGKLYINPHITSSKLYELLVNGPVFANVCSATLSNKGHQTYPKPNERVSVPDDIDGKAGTHSIVIYGNDEQGNYLVADPWEGLGVIKPETMICSITAAQIECDNQCFQITNSA